jgi:hypothetical protein
MVFILLILSIRISTETTINLFKKKYLKKKSKVLENKLNLN